MNGLLNLSEPGFLAVYLVGLGIAVQRARVARRRTRRSKGVPPRRPRSLEELAYLAGGPRRATETAVTRLVKSGALRLTPRGTVHAGSPSRDHRPRPMVDPRVVRNRLRTALLPLLVVAVFALVRWANDTEHGQPAGWLTAPLVITAAVGILLAHSLVPHRTVHGGWVLREANTNVHAVVEAECPPAGAARLIALDGPAAGRDLIVAGSRGPSPRPDRATRWPSVGNADSPTNRPSLRHGFRPKNNPKSRSSALSGCRAHRTISKIPPR